MPPRPPGSRGPSQADVARRAGVSTQTVSRVVSGQDNVSAQTALRVRRAVEDLGYRVHAAAASLASGRSRSLGVISAATPQYASAAIMIGVEAGASRARYSVTTATVPHNPGPSEVSDAFDRLEQQGVEGVIVLAPSHHLTQSLVSRATRLPTVGHRADGESGVAALVDQALIGRLATNHLLDLGHPTVWHVAGDLAWPDASDRRDAWERALLERGITPPPVIPGEWTPESGYRAGRTIASIPHASAVFVASDEMAFGVMRALHEAGLRVPGDVSVVSVDDIALAAYAAPALTTVRQPFLLVGQRAAERVIDQIEGRSGAAMEPLVPELLVRASTAPFQGRA